MNLPTTSIVDLPKSAKDDDMLGVAKYKNALAKFIEGSATPVTIALQGEWGSGKTSLMYAIQDELTGETNDTKPFWGIWINTWQYSLLNDPAESVMSIIAGIVSHVAKHSDKSHKMEKVADWLGRATIMTARLAGNVVGEHVGIKHAGDKLKAAIDEGKSCDPDIVNVKSELQKAITASIEKYKGKKGFIVFIDDLDRIDPQVAVQILELLKNIFDLDGCIFVLAIDYDVVVKGLRAKFGEMTSQNEREFRSFFDKIIQLPFSMPVSNYEVSGFLCKSLETISAFSAEAMADDDFKDDLTLLARYSIGKNPRSIKRLLNTLSLIKLLKENRTAPRVISTQDAQEAPIEGHARDLITFAIVCIQVGYPKIYSALQRRPDFTKWDDAFAQELRLAPVTENDKTILAREEFKPVWAQTVFRICQQDSFMSHRVFDLVDFFNKLVEVMTPIEGKNATIDSVIRQALNEASVTNVQQGNERQPIKVSDLDVPRTLREIEGSIGLSNNTTLKKHFLEITQTIERIKGNALTYRYAEKNGTRHANIQLEVRQDGYIHLAYFMHGHPFLENDVTSGDVIGEIVRHGKKMVFDAYHNEIKKLEKKYKNLHIAKTEITKDGRRSNPFCSLIVRDDFEWVYSSVDAMKMDNYRTIRNFIEEYMPIYKDFVQKMSAPINETPVEMPTTSAP